jgi:uncharacterized membrane protein
VTLSRSNTRSKPQLVGAACLLLSAPVVIAGTLLTPTLSDDAAAQVAGLTAHRGAAVAGLTLTSVALLLQVVGIIWLALTAARNSPKLALAGGAFGVAGAFIVMFENGIQASLPSVVSAMSGSSASSATSVVDRIGSSTAAALDPLSLLGDLGLILLGVAAIRFGAPRAAAVVLTVGAIAEGAGFGSATKALVVVGFALVFLAAAVIVRAAFARSDARTATATQPAQAIGV